MDFYIPRLWTDQLRNGEIVHCDILSKYIGISKSMRWQICQKTGRILFSKFYGMCRSFAAGRQTSEGIMIHFDLESLPVYLDEMHKIEHEADLKKHDLLNTLAKAFITPIEQEDIMQISQNLDDLTDKIEDVLIRIYYNHITEIRSDALGLVDILIRCCEEVCNLMREFPEFKRSKRLHEHIVCINSLEEEVDRMFIDCMRELHSICKDPFNVIAWREIYLYLEKCADTCEHIADIVESAIMKNS